MPASNKCQNRDMRKTKKPPHTYARSLDMFDFQVTLTPDILTLVVGQLDKEKSEDMLCFLTIQRCSSIGWNLVSPIIYKDIKINNWTKFLLSGMADESRSSMDTDSSGDYGFTEYNAHLATRVKRQTKAFTFVKSAVITSFPSTSEWLRGLPQFTPGLQLGRMITCGKQVRTVLFPCLLSMRVDVDAWGTMILHPWRYRYLADIYLVEGGHIRVQQGKHDRLARDPQLPEPKLFPALAKSAVLCLHLPCVETSRMLSSYGHPPAPSFGFMPQDTISQICEALRVIISSQSHGALVCMHNVLDDWIHSTMYSAHSSFSFRLFHSGVYGRRYAGMQDEPISLRTKRYSRFLRHSRAEAKYGPRMSGSFLPNHLS